MRKQPKIRNHHTGQTNSRNTNSNRIQSPSAYLACIQLIGASFCRRRRLPVPLAPPLVLLGRLAFGLQSIALSDDAFVDKPGSNRKANEMTSKSAIREILLSEASLKIIVKEAPIVDPKRFAIFSGRNWMNTPQNSIQLSSGNVLIRFSSF
jgi:hypothetical protein